jgi:hypothetical protein
MIGDGQHLDGFEAPLHRALAEPILLGGAPRAIAIVNGTSPPRSAWASSNGSRACWSGRRPQRSRCSRRSAIPTSPRCWRATSPAGAISHAEPARISHRADRLADHLPWAALVAPGVVLNKDGSFQRTLRFRGPDLESATEAELVSACARANNVLKRFGSGWALFIEAERREALGYPDSSFPDAASWLVDEERRGAFEAAGAHFESRYHLT